MSSNVAGMQIHEISLNPFKMHLTDALLAIHLAKEAKIGAPEPARAIRSMLCRTGVSHAVFAFECAANCFLDQIPRTRDFREKAEQWPALDKFDLYLMSVPGAPKLPRDDVRVKAMVDLIKIRDKHVHPRIVTHPVSKSDTADILISLELPETQTLKLVPMGMAWTWKDGSLAINTVLDFLRLFIGLTKVSAMRVRAILSDVVKCKDGLREADTGRYDDLLKISTTIGVDVSFLLRVQES
jgi:hypothetical protein